MNTDDLDDDFGTRPPQEVVAERLVHGQSRRTMAAELGLQLHQVHPLAAQAVREWSGATGSPRERLAVVHMQLDDITSRAYAALEDDRAFELAPLLTVLIDAIKVRAALLAAEARQTREARDE